MLKLKFEADYKEISKILTENGDKALVKFINEDGYWLAEATLPQMKKLGVALNNLDSSIEVKATLEDYEGVDFVYDDILKKIFLVDLSERWEVQKSLEYAINAMESVEVFEKKYGKSFMFFTTEEVEETAVGLFDHRLYYSLRFRINLYDRVQKFYDKDVGIGENAKSWLLAYNAENLGELLQAAGDEVLTRDELIKLFEIMPNMQDSIIPILIFEGVRYSKTEETDELRYLKSNNVKDGKLILEPGGSKADSRIIEIDKDVEMMIQKAMTQKLMIRVVKHNKHLVETVDSPYVLRPVKGVRMRDDNSLAMSRSGVYNRINLCQDQFEATMDGKKFTPKLLEQCGKSYYVSKFMSEGMSLQEALSSTLKRFGDWTYLEDESREMAVETNRSRMWRLEKIWEVFENGTAERKIVGQS